MSIADHLEALVRDGGPTGHDLLHGLTLAKVTNINDEEGFNRVKCLPIGSENEEETDWCYVMTPMGGKDCGMFFFPQVDDLVVLAFLNGDPHRPLVLGAYWNTEVTPPYAVAEGKAEDYSIRTPRKIELLMHDEDSKQKVTLTMPSGTVLTIDDENKLVSVQDQGGDNLIKMDLGGGEISVKAKTKISLDAGGTVITLESSGNITQKGNGTISIQGTNVEGKASGQLALKGATAEMKADAKLDLSASGSTTLKGGIVQIN